MRTTRGASLEVQTRGTHHKPRLRAPSLPRIYSDGHLSIRHTFPLFVRCPFHGASYSIPTVPSCSWIPSAEQNKPLHAF